VAAPVLAAMAGDQDRRRTRPLLAADHACERPALVARRRLTAVVGLPSRAVEVGAVVLGGAPGSRGRRGQGEGEDNGKAR
jgi:hypothetical protein